MKAPHALTLRDRHNSKEFSDSGIKRKESLESIFWMEDLIEEISPLPTTYDILANNSYTFNEFIYTDVWNGLFLYTFSSEVNARVVEESINKVTDFDVLLPQIKDKYDLHNTQNICKKIIFLPGSNLLHAVNWNKVSEILYSNPEIMVKPHPIMTKEGLRLIAFKVGFNKIIPPEISGNDLIRNCDECWGTMNSEMGLKIALLRKKYHDITELEYKPIFNFSSVYRLFNEDINHNEKIVKAFISSPSCGLLLPWLDKEENKFRAESYFRKAMEIRERLKPSYPYFNNLKFLPNNEV